MAFKLEIKDHSNKYQYVTRDNGVPGINIGAMKSSRYTVCEEY